MKSSARLAAALFSVGTATGGAAQELPSRHVVLTNPGIQPVMTVLMGKRGAQLFAEILRTSELTRDDFAGSFVTFLLPRDKTCTDAQRALLRRLTTKESARAYVLSHAFEGSITTGQNEASDTQREVWVSFWSGEQNIEGRGRVDIDDAHPLSVHLVSGKSVLVTLNGGVIGMGADAKVRYNGSNGMDGGWMELDHCAVF
jgi:hypothetical protein